MIRILPIILTLSALAFGANPDLDRAKLETINAQTKAAQIELEMVNNPDDSKTALKAARAKLKAIRAEIKASKAKAKAAE